MQSWQLQQAKAHLSELVKSASNGKPQEITLRGKPAVIVLSTEQYLNLLKPQLSLVDFLRKSPLLGIELNIERDSSLPREIDL